MDGYIVAQICCICLCVVVLSSSDLALVRVMCHILARDVTMVDDWPRDIVGWAHDVFNVRMAITVLFNQTCLQVPTLSKFTAKDLQRTGSAVKV